MYMMYMYMYVTRYIYPRGKTQTHRAGRIRYNLVFPYFP